MKKKRDEEKEGFRTRGIQERRDTGKEGSGPEGCRTGEMLDRRNAGKVGC